MTNPRVFLLNNTIALFYTLLVVTWLLSVSVATAQQAPVIKIKPVAAANLNPSDGREMYARYCAACHGVKGKGDGPAAPAFQHPPTNLTLLAEKNGGKFPALEVLNTLEFGPNAPAHGNLQMPVWGNLFRQMDWHAADDNIPQIRKHVLSEYIKTLQAK